jgi:hypothetical protein
MRCDVVIEKKQIPVWPVVLLALPAAVAIWSGWVGLGGLTGFGTVKLLPGIWDGLQINTAITLPIGMEAYAAYAIRVWLANRDSYHVPDRAREFAKWSSIGALVLGALGQVTFHLLNAAGVTSAAEIVTALVSVLPVGVLGLGASLAHLLRDGAPLESEVADVPETVEVLPEPVSVAPAPLWPVVQPAPGESLAARVAAAQRVPVLEPAVEEMPEPVVMEIPEPELVPAMSLNGSAGTTGQAPDTNGREPSVVSESTIDTISTRDYILSVWKRGKRVESSDLYERFPDRKRESLRSVLSTVRRGKDAGLEPPVRSTEEM